jgi:hypothetical protein
VNSFNNRVVGMRGRPAPQAMKRRTKMSEEKIELIIKAIESGDVDVALNVAKSALKTMNKADEVKEFISDYPMSESMLICSGI